MRKKKIQLLTVGVVVLLGGALTSCSSSGPGQQSSPSSNGGISGEINMIGYTGIYETNFQKAIVDPFEKKFPGVKVNYKSSPASAQTLANLQGSKANPNTDVVIMAAAVAKTANADGIFAKLDSKKVPNLKDIVKEGQTPGGFGPALHLDALSIIYNTEQVTTPPTSWKDLWDSKYAGKVVLSSPPDIRGMVFTILANQMAGQDDYKKTIEPGLKELARLAPSVQTYAPNPDVFTLVANGTATIGIGWNARAQAYKDQTGGKLSVVIPDGSFLDMGTINLVKGAKNAEAAQVFINYALSPEAQASFGQAMYYVPSNSKTELGNSVRDRVPLAAIKNGKLQTYDLEFIGSNLQEWARDWQTKVISK